MQSLAWPAPRLGVKRRPWGGQFHLRRIRSTGSIRWHRLCGRGAARSISGLLKKGDWLRADRFLSSENV